MTKKCMIIRQYNATLSENQGFFRTLECRLWGQVVTPTLPENSVQESKEALGNNFMNMRNPGEFAIDKHAQEGIVQCHV